MASMHSKTKACLVMTTACSDCSHQAGKRQVRRFPSHGTAPRPLSPWFSSALSESPRCPLYGTASSQHGLSPTPPTPNPIPTRHPPVRYLVATRERDFSAAVTIAIAAAVAVWRSGPGLAMQWTPSGVDSLRPVDDSWTTGSGLQSLAGVHDGSETMMP